MENSPKITTVMHVREANEEYIREALESIHTQTILAQEKIQLVLVCSKESIELCQQLMGENECEYITFDGDCTASYNICIPKINGQYVHFTKSEDKISENLYENVCAYLDQEDSVDFAWFPMRHLDGTRKIRHPLYPSYTEPRVIDMELNYNIVPISANGAIFRQEYAQKYKFNESMPYNAMADYVLRAAMPKMRAGYVPYVMYLYREQLENAIETIHTFNKEWYFSMLTDFAIPLLNQKKTPLYLQFAVYYHIQWAFLANINLKDKGLVAGEDFDTYLSLLKQVFSKIEDFILLNRDGFRTIRLNPLLTYRLYQLKHGLSGETLQFVYGRKDALAICGDIIIRRFSNTPINIQNLEYIDGALELDVAFDQLFDPSRVHLYAMFNKNQLEFQPVVRYSFTKYFGKPAYQRTTLRLRVPLSKSENRQELSFYASLDGKITTKLKINYAHPQCKITKSPSLNYWHFDRFMAYNKSDTITIIQAKRRRLIKREFVLLKQMFSRFGKQGRKAIKVRLAYWITRPYFKKKRIWLTFDKFFKGGDNGEYFYKYACTRNDGITPCYVINRDSLDYTRLRNEGYKPLVNGSLKHKLYFLNASVVLETHGALHFLNGFSRPMGKFYRGLLDFSAVTLQHGLAVQKIAYSMNRVHDNLKRYYCTSKYEVENVRHPIYGYNDEFSDVIRLTGQARYDGLYNKDKKEILISPTWRMYLALPRTQSAPAPYNPAFKDSSYYKVYDMLIHDERLIETAREMGYSITYLLHPTVSVQYDDFDNTGYVNVVSATADTNYEQVLSEASLLVTDYSGIQFDFAFMRKPIVYYHNTEIPPHYEEGFFSYETMAFGEICKSHKEIVELLIGYMRNDCALKDEFRARIDDFIAFDDHNNCQRIYDDVLELQRERDNKGLKKA